MLRQLKTRFATLGLAAALTLWGNGYVWGEPLRPAVKETPIPYGELENGDFEEGIDEFGGPAAWDVWCSGRGSGNTNMSWAISQENDNTPDTTKKLSLANSPGRKADYSVSQEIYHMKAGTYTAALLFEGESDDMASGSVLSVNGRETGLGSCLGWKKWKQAVLPDVVVEEGGTVRIEIRGTLEPGQWLDLDHVQFVSSAEFEESKSTWKAESAKMREAKPVKDAPLSTVTGQIQNGTFNQGVEWDVKGYPDGYLNGWTLPKANWDAWIYNGSQGEFDITNISDSKAVREFEIKQKVKLKPGAYQINSVIGGRWSNSESNNEVCIRVAQPDGVFIGERYWETGYGQAVSDEFDIDSPMEVTVSFTFMLSGGRNASLDNKSGGNCDLGKKTEGEDLPRSG